MKTLIAITLLALTCTLNAEFPDTPTKEEWDKWMKEGVVDFQPGTAPIPVSIHWGGDDSEEFLAFKGALTSLLLDDPQLNIKPTGKTRYEVYLKFDDKTDSRRSATISYVVLASAKHNQGLNSQLISFGHLYSFEFARSYSVKSLKDIITDAVKINMFYWRTKPVPE